MSGTANQVTTVMRRVQRWACIVGPQAAGKSTYVQYLQQFGRLRGFRPSGWRLHPEMESALGGLHLSEIRQAESLALLTEQPHPVGPPASGFSRIRPTKDILHFEALGGRGANVAGRLGVHFFDVPGEWASMDSLQPAQREPLEALMRETRLVVLLIPFWALLPAQWLIQHGARCAGDAIWATSLAVSASRHGQVEQLLDMDALAQSVISAHRNVESWVETILTLPRHPVDVLIVFSQFQHDAFVRLYDGYRPREGGLDALGSALWRRYDELLGAKAVNGHPLAALSDRFTALRQIARDWFYHLQREVPRVNVSGSQYVPSPALEALRRIFPFDDRNELPAVQQQRRKVRSVSVFPLNTVNLTLGNLERFDGAGLSAEEAGDLRMCEDVVWWIALQSMAGRLWAP